MEFIVLVVLALLLVFVIDRENIRAAKNRAGQRALQRAALQEVNAHYDALRNLR